ncbi:MAG: hypothetical protein NC084_01510 [Bacteroides sp.]|nr:hypothetical protein [Eubacterium sp.]MCM1417739.1 hypothetical protein [Roseburia sp.]MCM1461370.1 hypothetical protein [Bacteroides sp.]
MTELEEAIMGKPAPADANEKPGAKPLDDRAPEPEEGATPDAPDELIRDSIDAVRRMTEQLQLDNERLERNFTKLQQQQSQPTRKPAPKRKYVYVGTLSASLSLIVMGIAMIFSLFSPIGILGAFKLAPIMLVFLGVEVLLAVVLNRNVRLRFHKRSIVLTVALLAVTFLMSLISVNNSVTEGERAHAEDRLCNMLSHELRDQLPAENIRNVGIEMFLYGDDPNAYNALTDLEDTDLINLSVEYAKIQENTYRFAEDSRRILDALGALPYRFGEIDFVADDGGNRYSLELSWLYQSDLTTAELVPLVGYYGEDVVSDIPDLIDD